jgi:hypothetical protein
LEGASWGSAKHGCQPEAETSFSDGPILWLIATKREQPARNASRVPSTKSTRFDLSEPLNASNLRRSKCDPLRLGFSKIGSEYHPQFVPFNGLSQFFACHIEWELLHLNHSRVKPTATNPTSRVTDSPGVAAPGEGLGFATATRPHPSDLSCRSGGL